MRSLDCAGLQRRLTNVGMVLPNGRALNVSGAAWEDLLDRSAREQWSTSWPESGEGSPRGARDLSDDALAVAYVQVTPTVLVIVYPSRGTDAVRFDFDVREMRQQVDADALSNFIRMLGQTVGRPVELSDEGRDGDVFATYAPDLDEFEWAHVP